MSASAAKESLVGLRDRLSTSAGRNRSNSNDGVKTNLFSSQRDRSNSNERGSIGDPTESGVSTFQRPRSNSAEMNRNGSTAVMSMTGDVKPKGNDGQRSLITPGKPNFVVSQQNNRGSLASEAPSENRPPAYSPIAATDSSNLLFNTPLNSYADTTSPVDGANNIVNSTTPGFPQPLGGGTAQMSMTQPRVGKLSMAGGVVDVNDTEGMRNAENAGDNGDNLNGDAFSTGADVGTGLEGGGYC